ncbi:MAG: hypothetical protein JXR48_15170 [Candidatus Delongbacteria bacterium]|nr:hypothetical protein [Candidatus Delongbacteria bacterium]MBN2836298.1 hypothetical protein [Candidatus Delongbacteria bacterium]
MKRLLLLIIIVGAVFYSCSTDYEGSVTANEAPSISFADTGDSIFITNKLTQVYWYGNDIDDREVKYYYIVTTDMDTVNLKASNKDYIFNEHPYLKKSAGNWKSTKSLGAKVSFPTNALNSDTHVEKFHTKIDTIITAEDTTAVELQQKIVVSRIFVYAEDSANNQSQIIERTYGRTNYLPEPAILKCTKFNGDIVAPEYNQNTGVYTNFSKDYSLEDVFLSLNEETSTWKAFHFQWTSSDPDGGDVELEYSWHLEEIYRLEGDTLDTYETVAAADGWSKDVQYAKFTDVIFKHLNDNPERKYQRYKFTALVRDDAKELSEVSTFVTFYAYAPLLNKGIIFVDDNAHGDYDAEEKIGQAEPESLISFYKGLLEEAGYTEEVEGVIDPNSYKYWMVDELGAPAVQDLTDYKVVIVASDDRTKTDMNILTNNITAFTDFLNVGGSLLMMGNDFLMDNISIQNNTNSAGHDELYSVFVDATGNNFTKNCLGLYKKSNGVPFSTKPANEWRANYDCLGADQYVHATNYVPMTFNKDTVNFYWSYEQINNSGNIVKSFKLDRYEGTVYPTVGSVIISKGTPILRYKSVYDLPLKDGEEFIHIDQETGIEYDVHLINAVPGASNELTYITHKTGTVGTQLVSDGDIYRTVLIHLPLFFMDNTPQTVMLNGASTENVKPVSHNFQEALKFLKREE